MVLIVILILKPQQTSRASHTSLRLQLCNHACFVCINYCIKLGLQYDADDACNDARTKTLSRCQNADADAVPSTISFDDRQRRATTHAHDNCIQKSVIWFSFPEFLPHQVVEETLPHYLVACCWKPSFFDTFSKRFSCASHL